MEHLEVMPISSRVVCLNAPYLKSLCVFESLSRTLECYYNHHRPQVVSCQTTVRLPAPRIVRIRGHASHVHAPCDSPAVQTTIQMGTYLLFYLKDWSEIHKCHLILNGIEKVPRTKVPSNVLLERVSDPSFTASNSEQGKNLTNGSYNNTQEVTRVNEPLFSNIRPSDKVFNVNTLPKPRRQLINIPVKDTNTSYTTMHHTKTNPPKHCKLLSTKIYPPKPPENETTSVEKRDNRDKSNTTCNSITINMDQSEEITTLLDDDDDDDSEYSSDTSDDLHKVVRKRLSVDITALLHSCPNNNILILLLRPAEETQAWQFLSSCMKVTHYSKRSLVTEGTGTIKKALTRTRPIYFSKNGNAQRL